MKRCTNDNKLIVFFFLVLVSRRCTDRLAADVGDQMEDECDGGAG